MDLNSQESVKYACSLGTLCQSAEVLKRNNLKACSYPFDWVFTDAKVISDCVQDEFKKFLNKDFMGEPSERWGPRQATHKIYDPHKSFCFFFHKDPRKEDHYKYYIRCVERFKRLLQSKEKKLFLAFVSPYLTRHPKQLHDCLINSSFDETFIKVKEEFSELNHLLRAYTSNYSMMVVMNLPEQSENSHEITKDDNLEFLKVNTLSHSNGIKFFNEQDNQYLDSILNKNFNFEIKTIDV